MNKYIAPELELVALSVLNIIATSTEEPEQGPDESPIIPVGDGTTPV